MPSATFLVARSSVPVSSDKTHQLRQDESADRPLASCIPIPVMKALQRAISNADCLHSRAASHPGLQTLEPMQTCLSFYGCACFWSYKWIHACRTQVQTLGNIRAGRKQMTIVTSPSIVVRQKVTWEPCIPRAGSQYFLLRRYLKAAGEEDPAQVSLL